jgi:hypothetical protein
VSPDDWSDDGQVRRSRPAGGPEAAVGDSYGPARAEAVDALVYEEFSCDEAMIVAVRDTADEDAWVQSTLAVPIRE